MQTLDHPNTELVAWLDEERPFPAEHIDPAWPANSASHCGTCRDRKAAAFAHLYANPSPGHREAEHVSVALRGTGRFSLAVPGPSTRR